MADDPKLLEVWKTVVKRQNSEATLHWHRNSYFSVVASILILALSQFNIPTFQIVIAVLGFALSVVWLFIQYRSSKYIEYWKNEVRKLESTIGIPSVIFPQKLGGVEMRKLTHILPLVFMAIWIALIAISYSKLVTPTG